MLLDTHDLPAVGTAEPTRLPPVTRKRLQDAEVYVSAAAIWEIEMKSRLENQMRPPLKFSMRSNQQASGCLPAYRRCHWLSATPPNIQLPATAILTVRSSPKMARAQKTLKSGMRYVTVAARDAPMRFISR